MVSDHDGRSRRVVGEFNIAEAGICGKVPDLDDGSGAADGGLGLDGILGGSNIRFLENGKQSRLLNAISETAVRRSPLRRLRLPPATPA